MHGPAAMTRTTLILLLAAGCGAAATPPPAEAPTPVAPEDFQREADVFLAFYRATYTPMFYETSLAFWDASVDVGERNTGRRTGADTVYSAFTGSADFIRRARALLEHEDDLDDVTVRELRRVLHLAAAAPQTNPELARRRVAAESEQSARLDGFQFCLERRGQGIEAPCRRPVTTNDLDRTLRESSDLRERLRAWNASKEVGFVLKDGLVELRALRNGVAREMGHDDFFAFQVDDYGMSADEMMVMLDELVAQTRPLYVQLHCWARHELARRYGVEDVPRRIPAHWIGNRWAQRWPGLVASVDRDALLEGKTPQWLLEQAERFYVSMGFPELPQSFWDESDLYPVPEGETREKNDHASAWHLDLGTDVRSLMSVEADWTWFGTTHHELGHIYYYLAYTHDAVPPLLRGGANRSFHEGIGTLIEHASGMTPYLVELGLMREDDAPDSVQLLLDSALTGPIVFLPFAAGTMSHFEKALYTDELDAEQLQATWWDLVGQYQGVVPPADRPADACDACTKTHINDDPAQYYDYALSEVFVHQLHDHICRSLLSQDPHACNYYGRREVGDFLLGIMRPGATRDWRELLRETTGRDLTAEPMLEYYRPLLEYLEAQNQGRQCDWAADAT
jgi:peptidyl-dipeptidase A